MRPRSFFLLLALASIAVLGCDEDGSSGTPGVGAPDAPSATAAPDPGEPDPGDGDDETAAPEPEPEPEPAPEPEPGPSETAPSSPAESEDDDSSLLPILLGIGLFALAAGVVAALAGRRSKSDEQAAPAAPTTPSPQVALLTNAQWIHDHLTLELLAAPPADALTRWATERRRLDDVAIGAQQEYASGHGEVWSGLSTTMAALASALDTNLRLRAQVPPDPTLIQESTAVVNRQRATLVQQIAALWPTAAPTTTQPR